MRNFRQSSYTSNECFNNKHRFEHWYRDNSVYFITAKIRDGFHAFATAQAQATFWDRFDHYTKLHGFVPWVTTLMINHYHFLGYLREGEQLDEMMRKLHGSIAWLTMKELQMKHVPFWRDKGKHNYFDGCIRDVLQAECAGRYTLTQAVRAGIVTDWHDYPGTRVYIEMNRAIKRAVS